MSDDLCTFRNRRKYRDEEQPRENDKRTRPQRDRDRILHSEALRRLANVTQVVDPNEGHIFHNRLTHSLKVAQVAQRLTEKLIAEQSQLARDFCLDVHVVESAALAHDLGHPPFGHIAETELDRLVKEKGLADGYEGNPQSFRILTKLESRGEDHIGLDLTRATLNGVLKYPRLRAESGDGHKKWGAYRTEEAIFRWVREWDFDNVRSIEAELMDLADDIAFSVHDVEDFYRAGLIPNTIFGEEATQEELSSYLEEVGKRWYRNKKFLTANLYQMKQLIRNYGKRSKRFVNYSLLVFPLVRLENLLEVCGI